MEELSYSFIQSLKELPFIEKIYLYGSRARGDNQLRSDIDLAIVMPKGTLDDWTTVMRIIDNADTLLKIDCVRFDELKNDDRLKLNIIHDGKVIYTKDKYE